MKLLRILVPMLLLLAAVPSFALCGYCRPDHSCETVIGENNNRCRYTIDGCEDALGTCTRGGGLTLLGASYRIASVEIVTPAGRTKSDIQTPRLADARAEQQPAPRDAQPAH